MQRTWKDVDEELTGLAAVHEFSAATIQNARTLIAFASSRYRVPDTVEIGYWPTISLNWTALDAPIEVEVHHDHFEFYQFFTGRTDITEFRGGADGQLPFGLRDVLDARIAAGSQSV